MIEAEQFVEAARGRGLGWYAGVPCSFLTPFINYVINDPALDYLSAANEGDAVAAAVGAAVGGRPSVAMMQNSGLGNAVSPLTSLAYVFRVPLLLISTLRGEPGLKDEPQHALMGRITGALLETMEIPWRWFPQDAAAIAPALDEALDYMVRERRPFALIMRKGTIAPHALKRAAEPPRTPTQVPRSRFPAAARISRSEALGRILTLGDRPDTVLIATTGYTGRELFALADRSNQLYMVGSMGCASSLGLGLALTRPDLRVVVIDGDGAALMRMGNMATVGACAGGNLVHVVLDNEAHDSTGAQATVSASVSFAGIAEACGYGAAFEGEDPTLLDALFTCDPGPRPRLGHLKIATGTRKDLPRPDITPQQVLDRLMGTIGSRFLGASP